MHFDRFDICEAYELLERDFNSGGIVAERQAARLNRRSIHDQLRHLYFRPRPDLSYETLTENGKAIYNNAVARWGLDEYLHNTLD